SQKFKVEVRNVFEAYEYLFKLNPLQNFSDMNEQVLKNTHELLMKDLTGHPDGYRLIPVSLEDGNGQTSYIPPAYIEVPNLMEAFFNWLYTSVTGHDNQYDQQVNYQYKIHPLLISAISHHVIGYVHPFPDGNGRTARAFSTLVALIHPDLSTIKDAFSVEEFFDKRIEEYYDTLMLATKGDLKPFLMFYLECINESLMKVLNELQRYDRIKHVKELLGKGHSRTMFEIIARMEDGEHFHRQLFDDMLNASGSSIAKNLSKLKELNIIKTGESRGEYIVSILD
ncbi:Fic family protein, partial [Virgibacillus sp. DJP39]|uniref:Fic family protein n=1 Tax=Virgibacillus sp. DJP39 TaxID=3409790 RepID=UPI003BB69642